MTAESVCDFLKINPVEDEEGFFCSVAVATESTTDSGAGGVGGTTDADTVTRDFLAPTVFIITCEKFILIADGLV